MMSRRPQKLIITCALTGSETYPTAYPYLPITPDQIADAAHGAYEAGASIVHVHARNPKNGEPTADLGVWRDIVTKIKERCDVVVCITTGGAPGMSVEERIAVVPEFQPEMCSFNMESMNFSVYPLLNRYDWEHDWEREAIESSHHVIAENNFRDLEYYAKIISEHDVKPECEIYGSNGLYNTRYLARQGLIDPPYHLQFVLGVLGGTGAYPQELIHLQTEALRMFGHNNSTWSVIGVGYPRQFQMAALSIAMGGHVRVGVEDNIFVRYMKYAKSNAELVAEVVKIAEVFNREIATPNETREILSLKGVESVNF
jgi:uncharacterized protein (DUF849 family)